jgi:hypothetical protein
VDAVGKAGASEQTREVKMEILKDGNIEILKRK